MYRHRKEEVKLSRGKETYERGGGKKGRAVGQGVCNRTLRTCMEMALGSTREETVLYHFILGKQPVWPY